MIYKCYFYIIYISIRYYLKLPGFISKSVSNENVSGINGSTDICNILKSNLFAKQILKMTVSFYTSLKGDSNGMFEVMLTQIVRFWFFIKIESLIIVLISHKLFKGSRKKSFSWYTVILVTIYIFLTEDTKILNKDRTFLNVDYSILLRIILALWLILIIMDIMFTLGFFFNLKNIYLKNLLVEHWTYLQL